MPLPKRVADRLAADAAETDRRIAKPYACRKCAADCLRGDDHDRCSLTVVADAAPVDPLDQALAVLDGLQLYRLTSRGFGGSHEMTWRDPWFFTVSDDVIVVEHRCKGA